MADAPKTGAPDRPYAMALGLVFQLGLIIALPIILLGLGGAYADRHLGTSPYLVIAGFAVAALVSAAAVRSRVRMIVAGYQKQFPPRPSPSKTAL